MHLATIGTGSRLMKELQPINISPIFNNLHESISLLSTGRDLIIKRSHGGANLSFGTGDGTRKSLMEMPLKFGLFHFHSKHTASGKAPANKETLNAIVRGIERRDDDPSPDILTTFEKAHANKETLDAIVTGTEKCLLILLPWSEARSDNPRLQLIIEKIVNNCAMYIQAIDLSLKLAEDGYSLANDAVDICKFVVDPDLDPQALREYIDEMKEKAKDAHQDSKNISLKFREIQAGIFEMSKALPKELLGTPEGSKSRFIRFYSTVSQAASRIVTKPPADLKEAMAQLHLAAVDIGALHKTAENFVAWWAHMDTQLATVNTSSNCLDSARKLNRYRVTTIRNLWEQIRHDYGEYKVEIKKLQGYYPEGINLIAAAP